jgi:O-antigen/teichoic acid export membrane protein
LAVTGALVLSVLGVYRSCQNLAPEAGQKLLAAALAVGATLVCGLIVPRADVLLLALALVSLSALVPLVRGLPAIADLGSGVVSRREALRMAAPIGLLALATVAYYRSGTIVLAALGTAQETAVFTLAASLAFGLLMVPNAITTALLPRLAAEHDREGLVEYTRRTLVWTFVISVSFAAVAAAAGQVLVPHLVGSEYADARYAFAVLCLGLPIIAVSAVIATAFLAIRRLRAVGMQVSCTLLVNVAALLVLVPRLESVGAALATVAGELVGLVFLAVATRRVLPGLLSMRSIALRDGIAPAAERTLGVGGR